MFTTLHTISSTNTAQNQLLWSMQAWLKELASVTFKLIQLFRVNYNKKMGYRCKQMAASSHMFPAVGIKPIYIIEYRLNISIALLWCSIGQQHHKFQAPVTIKLKQLLFNTVSTKAKYYKLWFIAYRFIRLH